MPSFLLDAILWGIIRRRAWGESAWTARDLFDGPRPVLYTPTNQGSGTSTG